MDWLWQLVQDFANEWDSRRWGLVAAIVGATVLMPFLSLVHEAGHALAALAMRRRLIEHRVGDEEPMFGFRLRGFRVLLGPLSDDGDVGGYVLYEESDPEPWPTLVISLAGPLASLMGAVATGSALVSLPYSTFSVVLGIATLGGLPVFWENLKATGDHRAEWSDGRWARQAWRELRRSRKRAHQRS